MTGVVREISMNLFFVFNFGNHNAGKETIGILYVGQEDFLTSSHEWGDSWRGSSCRELGSCAQSWG